MAWIPQIVAVVLVVALAAAAVMTALALIRRYRQKLRTAMERWSSRSRLNDAGFLSQCGVAEDPLSKEVAATIRAVLAEYARVPAETISPEDKFSDFGCLLDSMDWLDVFFRTERSVGVKIDFKALDRAMGKSGWQHVTIKQFVLAVASSATRLSANRNKLGSKRARHEPSTGH